MPGRLFGLAKGSEEGENRSLVSFCFKAHNACMEEFVFYMYLRKIAFQEEKDLGFLNFSVFWKVLSGLKK